MKQGLYISVKDAETYKDAIVSAMVSEYMFSFPGNIIPRFCDAKKWYHGNSKLLLHMFYNDITKQYELSITTASVEKSYPQIKSVIARDLDSVNYAVLREVFGNYIPTVDR